jgi:hypothetical protein
MFLVAMLVYRIAGNVRNLLRYPAKYSLVDVPGLPYDRGGYSAATCRPGWARLPEFAPAP